MEDLHLNAFGAYNDAKYSSFPASPCYGGQTAAQGCVNGSQNLGGRTIYLAPKWVGSFGGSYKAEVGGDYYLTFNETTNFSSRYITTVDQLPNSYQQGWVTVDASLGFGKNDGPWMWA